MFEYKENPQFINIVCDSKTFSPIYAIDIDGRVWDCVDNRWVIRSEKKAEQ